MGFWLGRGIKLTLTLSKKLISFKKIILWIDIAYNKLDIILENKITQNLKLAKQAI